MKVDDIVSRIERGLLQSSTFYALHAALKKKGDIAYQILSAMESYSDAPFDAETKSITADLLQEHGDPMLAGRAMRVLVIAWGLHAEHRDEILRAIRGYSWDEDGEYKLSAVFCAGSLLSNAIDKEILAAVLRLLLDATEFSGTREAARDAIQRAMGKSSKEIVELSVRLDSTYVASEDEPVVWAKAQLQKFVDT